MGQPIGVRVIERDATIEPAIAPVDVTNTGIIGQFTRGPLNTAVEVGSYTEARSLFGDPASSSNKYGALVLRGLFKNAAPYSAKVYVVRVEGGSPAAATSTLTSGDTQFVPKPGATGTPANFTVAIAAGTNTGTKVTITDGAAGTETFDDIENVEQMCDAINRGLPGFNGGAASAFVNVAYAGTDLPDNLTETAMGGGLAVAAPVSAATDTVVSAGQQGVADPGTWGNSLKIEVVATSGAEYHRDVIIKELVGGDLITRERFSDLDTTDFEQVLNKATREGGSMYVAVTTPGDLPNPVTDAAFTSGADGTAATLTEYQGDQDTGTGIYAFDAVDVQMIASSDLTDLSLATELRDYAKTRGDVVAVACTPFGATLDTLYQQWKPLMERKSFLAAYRGWIQVDSEEGGRAWVPNVGHVIGAGYINRLLRKSPQGLPHIAPAGLDTGLTDALDLEFRKYTDANLEALVHDYGINAVMYVSGKGFVVRTSRTMSSLSANYSIHIRRCLNFMSDSLTSSLGFLEQEANNETTRAHVRSVLTGWLTELYNAGMFETRGGFSNNVAVKCDEENNPMSVVNQRKLVIDLKLRFVEIAEYIEVNLEATRDGIKVSDTV